LKALCAAHIFKIHCIFRPNKQNRKVKQSSKNAALALCSGLLAKSENKQQK